MSITALQYVNDLIEGFGIPYAFIRWNEKPPEDYYFVGEYNETSSPTKEEDGYQETTFILRGFTRKDWLMLEQAKQIIERNITRTAILPDGTGIAVIYDYGEVVPTGEADLKSIKINLTIKEWKVF